MATLPKADAALVRIVITLNGQAQQPAINIGNSDNITFYNGASFPVSIQFLCANGPVFNDIARIDPGKSSTAQYPQIPQITTDYQITNLNTQMSQGPYGIQVSNSNNPAPALLIPITNGFAPTDPNLQTISIPLQGWIQFNLDLGYTITWNPANAFPTPTPPTTIGPGLSAPYQAPPGNQVNSAVYTLNSSGIKGVVGHGTVKINA
jgi:hypothetical protein